jgi:hypothetical protein
MSSVTESVSWMVPDAEQFKHVKAKGNNLAESVSWMVPE